jgi:predicted phage-related endonuclease
MGSRSELDALLREVKRLSDAETRQREVVTELGRQFKDAELYFNKEITALEKRVEALEQAGRRVDIALPVLAIEAKS